MTLIPHRWISENGLRHQRYAALNGIRYATCNNVESEAVYDATDALGTNTGRTGKYGLHGAGTGNARSCCDGILRRCSELRTRTSLAAQSRPPSRFVDLAEVVVG